MGYLLRHMLAVLLLPVTVAVLIPVWIARRFHVQPSWPSTSGDLVLAVSGALALLLGLMLFGASVHLFFAHGRGTLAPWDPPRHFVVRGPYRYVRNPMISGVVFTLLGIALVMRSVPHALWAGTFLLIIMVYIPILEEPGLERRFGPAYEGYRRNVPRFIPRLRPWCGEDAERLEPGGATR